MNVPDASVLVGFTTVCGAFGFVGKMMISTLKNTITQNEQAATKREEAAEVRMVKQEGKTEACEKDRTEMREEQLSLKAKVERVERTLKIVKRCPEGGCPNRQLLQLTEPIGHVRE
jgi:hypothetical protein